MHLESSGKQLTTQNFVFLFNYLETEISQPRNTPKKEVEKKVKSLAKTCCVCVFLVGENQNVPKKICTFLGISNGVMNNRKWDISSCSLLKVGVENKQQLKKNGLVSSKCSKFEKNISYLKTLVRSSQV